MLPPDSQHPRFDAWQALWALRDAPDLIAEVSSANLADSLLLQNRLRQIWPAELVRDACALVDARRRARDKFSRADDLWLDRKGLEQATAEAVARHKALRFSEAVLDLCSGIGGDALALAARVPVEAVDLDPCAGQRLEWNAEVYGVASQVEARCADVTQCELDGRWLHLDPDRRTSGRKAVRLEDYVPGPDFLLAAMSRARGGAIKLSPAANFVGRFPDAEIELISLDGECKEATVWFGELAGGAPWRATVLPAGATLAGHPLEQVADLGPMGLYLYDPDPAVVRAGLVDLAANECGFQRLDASEEYLTSDRLVQTPFARGFEVEAVLPNNPNEIRAHFRQHPVGQVEIKCRHVPIDAEEIRRKLPLEGSGNAVLCFARIAGRTKAVVARRVVESSS